MHPAAVQISTSPFLFTAHAQRAGPSIHLPTAVLPSIAEASVDSVITATIAAKIVAAARNAGLEPRANIILLLC
jgi:hypothetical protein